MCHACWALALKQSGWTPQQQSRRCGRPSQPVVCCEQLAAGLLTSLGAGTLPALPSSSAVSSTRYISWRLCGLLLLRMSNGKNCRGTGGQGWQVPVKAHVLDACRDLAESSKEVPPTGAFNKKV